MTKKTTEDVQGRAGALADGLLGTQGTLEEFLSEDEQADVDLMAALDDLVQQCVTCGTWVEPSEVQSEGECLDCETDGE